MGKETEKIHNGYLTSSEMLDKLEELKVRIAQHLSRLFFSKSKKPVVASMSVKYVRETCGVCEAWVYQVYLLQVSKCMR